VECRVQLDEHGDLAYVLTNGFMRETKHRSTRRRDLRSSEVEDILAVVNCIDYVAYAFADRESVTVD